MLPEIPIIRNLLLNGFESGDDLRPLFPTERGLRAPLDVKAIIRFASEKRVTELIPRVRVEAGPVRFAGNLGASGHYNAIECRVVELSSI